MRADLTAAPDTVALATRDVPLRVRISDRSRRLALRIDTAGDAVELVLPRGVPLVAGMRFLEQRRGWIAARLDGLPPRVVFADGIAIPILGHAHVIRHLGPRPPSGARSVAIADGEIRVYGDPAHLARRVRDHLIAIARQECAGRARQLAVEIRRRVARVTVRDTKSRWGSCTSAGNLAFSWRLVLAPEAVLHYVVAHEVAHLAEMNHGPGFWRLVEQLAPGAARQRSWLNRNRTLLLRYG